MHLPYWLRNCLPEIKQTSHPNALQCFIENTLQIRKPRRNKARRQRLDGESVKVKRVKEKLSCSPSPSSSTLPGCNNLLQIRNASGHGRQVLEVFGNVVYLLAKVYLSSLVFYPVVIGFAIDEAVKLAPYVTVHGEYHPLVVFDSVALKTVYEG